MVGCFLLLPERKFVALIGGERGADVGEPTTVLRAAMCCTVDFMSVTQMNLMFANLTLKRDRRWRKGGHGTSEALSLHAALLYCL